MSSIHNSKCSARSQSCCSYLDNKLGGLACPINLCPINLCPTNLLSIRQCQISPSMISLCLINLSLISLCSINLCTKLMMLLISLLCLHLHQFPHNCHISRHHPILRHPQILHHPHILQRHLIHRIQRHPHIHSNTCILCNRHIPQHLPNIHHLQGRMLLGGRKSGKLLN